MRARVWLVVAVVAACAGHEVAPVRGAAAPEPVANGAAEVASEPDGAAAEGPTGGAKVKTTTRNSGDGRCEPMPRAGQPCAEGDSFCVLSWGQPGGWSSALWCRGGRWTIEEERNLPE